MHPLYKKADELSRVVIGAAIEVHRLQGAGLLFNFHEVKPTDGLCRMILPGVNQ